MNKNAYYIFYKTKRGYYRASAIAVFEHRRYAASEWRHPRIIEVSDQSARARVVLRKKIVGTLPAKGGSVKTYRRRHNL